MSEAKGSVSPKIFNDYENIVEDIIFDLEQFVKIEKEEVNAAHKHATQLIESSLRSVYGLGILSVLVAVILGYLVSKEISRTRELADANTALRTEITERKRAEEELIVSQRQLSAVLDTAGEGIITIDSTSTIVMVNQEAQNIWGYQQEELVGKKLHFLMPEKYRGAHSAGMKRYLRTGVERVLGKRLELEGLKNNGSTFPLEIRITETRSGQSLLFTAAVRDITERKRAEEELQYVLNEEQGHSRQIEQKARELKIFHDVAVGREEDMIKLKKQANALSRELGRAEPYTVP